MHEFYRDYKKAYGKARGWRSPWLQAACIALRYALTGDSGKFAPPGHLRKYRIKKSGLFDDE